MTSLLTDSPSSGYTLAAWAIQYAIEHPATFASFLESNAGIVNVIPEDIVPDLEMTKSLICELGTVTDSLISGKIGIRLMGTFPMEALFPEGEIPK
jgi:hypothetical protein